jgi:hypothetical protein
MTAARKFNRGFGKKPETSTFALPKWPVRRKWVVIAANRGVAERSNAAVLKTVEPQGSGGSNPSSSARIIIKNSQKPANHMIAGFFRLVTSSKYSPDLRKW